MMLLCEIAGFKQTIKSKKRKMKNKKDKLVKKTHDDLRSDSIDSLKTSLKGI